MQEDDYPDEWVGTGASEERAWPDEWAPLGPDGRLDAFDDPMVSEELREGAMRRGVGIVAEYGGEEPRLEQFGTMPAYGVVLVHTGDPRARATVVPTIAQELAMMARVTTEPVQRLDLTGTRVDASFFGPSGLYPQTLLLDMVVEPPRALRALKTLRLANTSMSAMAAANCMRAVRMLHDSDSDFHLDVLDLSRNPAFGSPEGRLQMARTLETFITSPYNVTVLSLASCNLDTIVTAGVLEWARTGTRLRVLDLSSNVSNYTSDVMTNLVALVQRPGTLLELAFNNNTVFPPADSARVHDSAVVDLADAVEHTTLEQLHLTSVTLDLRLLDAIAAGAAANQSMVYLGLSDAFHSPARRNGPVAAAARDFQRFVRASRRAWRVSLARHAQFVENWERDAVYNPMDLDDGDAAPASPMPQSTAAVGRALYNTVRNRHRDVLIQVGSFERRPVGPAWDDPRREDTDVDDDDEEGEEEDADGGTGGSDGDAPSPKRVRLDGGGDTGADFAKGEAQPSPLPSPSPSPSPSPPPLDAVARLQQAFAAQMIDKGLDAWSTVAEPGGDVPPEWTKRWEQLNLYFNLVETL